MNKENTPLSKFPTEVLTYNFKKLRRVIHREYENDECDLVINDETTSINDGGSDYHGSRNVSFNFEGLYWQGSIDELKDELNKRPNVNITEKNFKDWKREYKKNKKR